MQIPVLVFMDVTERVRWVKGIGQAVALKEIPCHLLRWVQVAVAFLRVSGMLLFTARNAALFAADE